VLIRHRASVERVLALPPGAFRPPPQVQSSVVRLRFHPPDPPLDDEAALEQVVKLAFAQRRKTLANALRSLTVSRQSDSFVDLRRRAETLSVAEFVDLAKWVRSKA
jgi:16S rRNA (adenine1518-N6/adenine1519-N6)-dimethyltransferase